MGFRYYVDDNYYKTDVKAGLYKIIRVIHVYRFAGLKNKSQDSDMQSHNTGCIYFRIWRD